MGRRRRRRRRRRRKRMCEPEMVSQCHISFVYCFGPGNLAWSRIFVNF
jgi:hypothetical protein